MLERLVVGTVYRSTTSGPPSEVDETAAFDTAARGIVNAFLGSHDTPPAPSQHSTQD